MIIRTSSTQTTWNLIWGGTPVCHVIMLFVTIALIGACAPYVIWSMACQLLIIARDWKWFLNKCRYSDHSRLQTARMACRYLYTGSYPIWWFFLLYHNCHLKKVDGIGCLWLLFLKLVVGDNISHMTCCLGFQEEDPSTTSCPWYVMSLI